MALSREYTKMSLKILLSIDKKGLVRKVNGILFEILKAVVVLVIIFVGRYGIPYVKQLAENKKCDWVIKWVEIAVKATEQTVFGDKKGPDRKIIVTRFIRQLLLQKNISMSDDQLSNLIDAAVFVMNGGKKQKEQ